MADKTPQKKDGAARVNPSSKQTSPGDRPLIEIAEQAAARDAIPTNTKDEE